MPRNKWFLQRYVFGLLFTDACLDYLREGNANDPLSPQKHFGSVSVSRCGDQFCLQLEVF